MSELKSCHFVAVAQSGHAALSEKGERQSDRAGEILSARELGNTTLILCSSDLSAQNTAKTITKRLQAAKPVSSMHIKKGCKYPDGILKLDEFILQALNDEEVHLEDEQPLVVVTHAPMIALAKRLSSFPTSEPVRDGEVFECVSSRLMENPDFNELDNQLLEIELGGFDQRF